MTQFSISTLLALVIRMPLVPVPSPLIEMFRIVTTSVAAATMLIPNVPAPRIEDSGPAPSMVIPLLIVTDPKPPGSVTSISPPAAVFEIAPANVLQGAVRLQGSASLPTPETHVRDWAVAEAATVIARTNGANARTYDENRMLTGALLVKTRSDARGTLDRTDAARDAAVAAGVRHRVVIPRRQ